MRVLITGASSGIGAALAKKMAADGDSVWLAARRVDKLEAVVAGIVAAGGVAEAVQLDVADADGLEAAIGALDARVGGFDIVVVNAGVGGRGATATGLRYGAAKDVLAINFVGAIATILAAQRPMIARGRGHIVVVSSLAGELPLPVAPEYGATKAGLSYYVEAMRSDLRRRGVRVTLVHPGFVKSEMTDKNTFAMPFIVDTDVAAGLIARATRRNTALLRFPFAYRVAFALAALLPRRLVAGLAIRSTQSGPAGMARRD